MKYIFLCTPEGDQIVTENIELLKKALQTGSHRIWLDIEDPTDEEIGMLGEVFHFPDLAVEQVIGNVDIPKLTFYESYAFLVLHRIFYNFETEVCDRREFEVFFSDKFIVTIHTQQLSRTFGLAREMERQACKDLLGKGTAFVLLRLLSLAVRDYLPVMEQWQDNLDDIEHQVLQCKKEKILDQILQFKKLVSTMRKNLLPEREVIAQFHEKTNGSFLSADARRR